MVMSLKYEPSQTPEPDTPLERSQAVSLWMGVVEQSKQAKP